MGDSEDRHVRLEPREGAGLEVSRGDRVTIRDVEGQQVVDVLSYARGSASEWLSNGRTFDYLEKLSIGEGDILYSNRSRPMWTLEVDRVGAHDFLIGACSMDMFAKLYGVDEDAAQPNCADHLTRCLRSFGYEVDSLPTPFNVFMNTRVLADGRIDLRPPLSRPGDFIVLRAEMDMMVAVSACSAPTCNNGSFGPVEIDLVRGGTPA